MLDLTNDDNLERERRRWQGTHRGRLAEPTTLVHDAAVALAAGAPETAVHKAGLALCQDAELAAAWTLYGQAAEALGHPVRAARAYERAMGLDAGDPATALRLVHLLRQTNHDDRARALLVWLCATAAPPFGRDAAVQLGELDAEARS